MINKLFYSILLMVFANTASASIIWEPDVPTNLTVNTLNLSGWDLGLFDDAYPLVDAGALLLTGISSEVAFINNGTSPDWVALNLSTGQDIILQDGNQFILAITDGTANTWYEATSAWLLAPNTTNYEVTFSNGVTGVFTFDATPTVVPVPAAAWLFGSGLIGLVAVARRKTS